MRVSFSEDVIKQWTTTEYYRCSEEGTYNVTDTQIGVPSIYIYSKKCMSCVKLIILATDTRKLRLKWLQQSVKETVPGTTHFYFGNRRLGQRCTWTSREPCGFPVFTFKAPTATTLLTCPQVLCVPENRYGACRPLTENLKYSFCYHEPYYPIHPTKPFGTPYSLLIQPILHKSLIRLQLYLASWAKQCHSHMLENATLFCPIIL